MILVMTIGLLRIIVGLDFYVSSNILDSDNEADRIEAVKKLGASVKSGFCVSIGTKTVSKSFQSIFVVRNTFHHSPALLIKFDAVITNMIQSSFANVRYDAEQYPKHRNNNKMKVEETYDRSTNIGLRIKKRW